ARPQIIISAFAGLFSRRDESRSDVLRHIELPIWISFVGIPIIGAVGVWMAHDWFGVNWIYGATAIPLIIVLTLIAANSTALTGITPTGAMSKIPQFIYGAVDYKTPATNLMTGVMCIEVSSNAANLLMDIKPGYMLGAKPRQQAIGHVLGILAGAVVAVPVYYAVFLHAGPQSLITDQYPFPGVLQWKAVAEVLTQGLSNLKPSAQVAALVGAIVGITLEVIKLATKGRFPISAVGMGLAFVLGFGDSLIMALGAIFFATI